MKFVISTAALLLLLGTSVSAYARQEKGQEQQKQQEAKPAQQHQRQAKPATRQQTQTRSSKPAKQQHTQRAARTQQSQTRAANRSQQGNSGRSQSRTQQTRASAGNNGRSEHGRISNDHYAARFGSEHRFHVNQGDYDHRRFDYGGYSFGFIDPWPMGWGYSDDVYVVYLDGGYYMYDVVHPGVRISINIL